MSFYVTGGTLQSDAPSYVEREADRQLYEGLLQGDFCYVLTARQMGKSSLMVRTANRLRTAGVHVVALDLTALGGQNITASQWYFGLLDTLGQELGLGDELEGFWQDNEHHGPLHRFMKSIHQLVLPRLDRTGDRTRPQAGPHGPTPLAPRAAPVTPIDDETARSISTKVRLVIFVDEIDFVRSLPFSTDEFFAAIRECYNHRTLDPVFEQVTFCLLGVASPSDLIQDTRMTPFNVGRRIELNDFTAEEAMPLVQGLEGRRLDGIQLLRRVLFWTGGHPYLTQRLCHTIAAMAHPIGVSDVDQVCQDLFLSHRARERDDNLIFVRERLLRNEAESANVLSLYRKVLSRRRNVADDETNPLVNLLRLSGVVQTKAGTLAVRNRIYERAFDRVWIDDHLPEAELRRQREAYRRGLMRAATVASGVFLLMAALVVWAVKSRSEAKDATWTALRDRARLSRMLGLSGQRFEALDPIRQAARIRPSPELRDEAIASLALPDLRRQAARLMPEKDAAALVFSDDQKLYAFGNQAGEVVLRRAVDDLEVARWPIGANKAQRLWFSRDNQLLAAAQADHGATELSVWRLSPREKLFATTNEMQVEAFDFSPDSRRLVVGDNKGMLQILALPDGQLLAGFEFGDPCSVVRFDSQGKYFAVASTASLRVEVYDASAGILAKTLHSASPPIHLAWHPDGQRLAAAGEDRRVRLWDIEADAFPKEELPRQMSDITALAYSRSGDLLASAFADRSVRLWDAGLKRLLLTAADAGNIRQLQFSPDDRRLGFARFGDSIQFWEVASGEECRTLFDFDADELSAIDIHPDGRLLAAAHGNGVTFWDLARARRVGGMAVGGTPTLRFHPVSGDLVTGEFRGTYRFRVEGDKRRGDQAMLLKPREDYYLSPGALALDLATEVDVLAVAYDDRIRLARNTNSAYAFLDELLGEPGFKTVALSPDGRQVAAGNWMTGQVWLWEWAVNSKPRKLRVDGPAHVRFSPDGRWLATGTEKMATLWDARSWEPALRVQRSLGVTSPALVAFAKNRLVWAVALSDTKVRLLEVDGRTIANLEPPHKELLVAMTFSPDGSRLVCGTSAKTIVVWDLDALERGLAQLGLDGDLRVSSTTRRAEPPLALEIGALDRLRFSQARHVIDLRREIAELTDLIRQDPGAWHYYQNRAERLRQLGEYEKAVQDYHRWIETDRTADPPREAKSKAWPLRDLALLHLSGPREVRDYEKALVLTQQALELDPANPDNHFRYGIACYRLKRYEEAENHLEISRRTWEKKEKNVAVVLFYEAMCHAHQKERLLASQLLEQAKQAYARTDLTYRESHAGELSDLLWEAERVVSEARIGG